jgi:2-polyprenyl-3-methyl-5-hydroxy-6-metoxy-1,4-benzoquinol methylase
MGFSSFLDLGCGLGRHSIQFAKVGFDVYALDFSQRAIDELTSKVQKANLNIHATRCDMIDLPYKENFFDCILAYHVISHTDTEGIQRTISEISRILKPNGEVFLTLCSKSSWKNGKPNCLLVDENTIIKDEEGPEKGIPHFFADDKMMQLLFQEYDLIHVRNIQETIYDNIESNTWHYFIHGKKREA